MYCYISIDLMRYIPVSMLFVKHTIIGVFWLEWVLNISPFFRGNSPNRRGEGGEEWWGGPLWSPAVPLQDGEPSKYIKVSFNIANIVYVNNGGTWSVLY
jgi:hypothetical protein